MAEPRKLYRIFVASPSDLAQERAIARSVIAAVSKDLGAAAKLTLSVSCILNIISFPSDLHV